MSDRKQNEPNENGFLIEKIKARPVNRGKLLRRTVITASMAVIFGLIACFTFLVLEPVISNWLYPEEEPQVVVFPEDQEEMSPEEMLAENIPDTESEEPASEEEDVTLKEEQIEEILSGVTLDKDNYREMYASLSEYVSQMNQYMVTITGVTSNIDWFNDVQESKNQTSGLIIADNGKELLILADAAPLRSAERLILTFSDNMQAEAQIKQQDKETNLAVLSVALSSLPEDMQEEMPAAVLGRSNTSNLLGTPVVALGSPMGVSNSVGYGMIAASSTVVYATDRNYRLLTTDINGSQNAGGVLFNLQGEVIGIITSSAKSGTDMKNMVTAYGITELKKLIEKMSNGSPVAYLGISGLDVTEDAYENQGMPYGAFVRDITLDSPAMLAGIQQGDVITQMDGKKVTQFSDYTTYLMQMEPGQTTDLTVMRLSQNEYKEMNFSIELGEEP
jgi:serine protease Do